MMIPNAYLNGSGVREMKYNVHMYCTCIYIPVYIIFLDLFKDLVDVALSNEAYIHLHILSLLEII